MTIVINVDLQSCDLLVCDSPSSMNGDSGISEMSFDMSVSTEHLVRNFVRNPTEGSRFLMQTIDHNVDAGGRT